MLFGFVAGLSVIAAVASLSINTDRLEDLRRRVGDIQNQLNGDESETRSNRLKEIAANIPSVSSRKGEIEDGFLCGMCFSIVGDFLNMRRVLNESEQFLRNLTLELCVDFEIQSEEVCHGVIELNAPSIFYIVDNRPDLTADTVCRVLLNDGACIGPHTDGSLDFSIEIDDGKVRDEKNFERQEKNSENLTIIHISDIHVDFKYKQGAFADCDEPACCREKDDVNEEDPGSFAGPWGDYRSCDTPWSAIVEAFHQITRQHSKIDAIYFTGDIVDHFMWDVSVAGMKYGIEKVYNLMRLTFGNIPMYPILGNHEAQNIFPPSDVSRESLSVQWLYDHFSGLLMEKLPPDAIETIKNAVYYTVLVRPGLRLIALNNNVCSTFNWWILYSVKSLQRQFQWLHDVLLSAEKAEEKVHILAHIPNSDEDYHEPCSREYRKIVERFHRTIAAQFNGHTEFTGFNVFRESNNASTLINVAWNGGSLATYSGVNRNYQLYGVDGNNYQVNDIESWIYNLTAANQNEQQKPVWFRQLSFRDAFNLPDLSPSTMNQFVSTLIQNKTAVQQLWRMRIRDSDLMLKDGCPKSCQLKILCEILITDISDTATCASVKDQLNGK